MDIFLIDEELRHFGKEKWYNLKKPFPEISKVYPKFYKSIWRMILCWAIFLVPVCLYFILQLYNHSFEDFSAIISCLLMFYSLFVIMKTFFQIRWYKVEKKLFYEKVNEWEKDPDSVNSEFYEACKKIGVNDLSSPENVAQIVEFARKNGSECTEDEIKQSFLYGEKKEEQEKERTYKNELEKYAELVGHEKTRAMLNGLIQEKENEIRELRNMQDKCLDAATNLYGSLRQKESDWAIRGGIADAIAGPAAGVMVARDVQDKNKLVKEHNEDFARTTMSLANISLHKIYSEISDREEKIRDYEEDLRKLNELIIEKIPEQELLDRLSLSVKDEEVTKTGAMKFDVLCKEKDRTTIKNKEGKYFYGRVDGSIRINLMSSNGEKLGEAIAVLPLHGLYACEYIHAISCDVKCVKSVKKFEFEPYHLWAVEDPTWGRRWLTFDAP